MATREQIHQVLDSTKFNEGEKSLVKWQVRMNGDFFTALWDAISRADGKNLELLAKAYPQHVQAYIDWSVTGTLAARLELAGCEL